MNHSRNLSDSRRSPHPRRRRSLVPRSPDLSRSLPAITLLSPDTYHLSQTMGPRPLSPGAFRMISPRSPKRKMSSFVILNETINSPVTSRAPSPSGRVSPFRGHGFKSPNTSRPASRAVSPLPSPTRRRGVVVPPDKAKLIYKDIGLPPKSPKKVMQNKKIKEFKPGIKQKPGLPMKPSIIQSKTKMSDNKKSMIMTTVDKRKNKKSPVPPTDVKKGSADKVVTENKETKGEESVSENIEDFTPIVVSEAVEANKQTITNKTVADKPKPETKNNPEANKTNVATENNAQESNSTKTEKIVGRYEPDVCCVVPPTMASPLQTATSTTTVPGVSSAAETTTTRAPSSSLTVVTSAVSATDAFSKSTNVNPSDRPITPKSPRIPDQPLKTLPVPGTSPGEIESAVATITTVDEVIRSRTGSAVSRKSMSKLSLESPTMSERTRSSLVTVRAASNGSLYSQEGQLNNNTAVSEAVMSTTKLIQADPDLEVLSPNNLLRSPPSATMRQPLWQEDRIPNGDSTSNSVPKGRCQRFLSALWRIVSYVFCCCKWRSCSSPRCCGRSNCGSLNCRNSNCCKKKDHPRQVTDKTPSCCARCRRRCSCNPCSFLTSCFSKLNCFKNVKCCKGGSCCVNPCGCSACCKGVKCCKGKKCCKKTTSQGDVKTSCCAKPSCNCKDCCMKMKNCCRSCGDCINSFCRSFFCLNLICCQNCLRKCTGCHKLKCCKKGGCCSCCNPNVKREQRAKLDKKNSRASNQSKEEKVKLDAALVDHTSMMKAAIPVLPACLAWFCCLLNVCIPGSGTLLSGLLCLCCGKPRFSVNDTPQNRMSSLLINIVIGVAQAFTIVFCLVGWGWSIWWGVIMIKLARKQKRLRIAEKNNLDSGPSTMNHVDVERQ